MTRLLRSRRALERLLWVLAPALGACDRLPPTSSVPPAVTWGAVGAGVIVIGDNQPNLLKGYAVALDSAIQGYGVMPIDYNGDTVVFVPVPPGPHHTTLRGAPPECVASSFNRSLNDVPSSEDQGSDYQFVLESGAYIRITYMVRC